MSSRAPPDWVAIRHAYEETDAPVASIAADHGLDRKDLANAARRHGWRRKHPRPFPAGRRPSPDLQPAMMPRAAAAAAVLPTVAVTTPPPTARPPSVPPAPHALASPLAEERHGRIEGEAGEPAASRSPPSPDRRRLLDRLVAAISLKLEQLERRMQDDLGLIERGEPPTSTDHEKETRAIGALIDNLGKITEIEGGLDRSGTAGKSGDASGLADDAERWRRELADRLARIVEASPRTS